MLGVIVVVGMDSTAPIVISCAIVAAKVVAIKRLEKSATVATVLSAPYVRKVFFFIKRFPFVCYVHLQKIYVSLRIGKVWKKLRAVLSEMLRVEFSSRLRS